MTPQRAIHARCLDCVGGARAWASVRDCDCDDCPLYPYRQSKPCSGSRLRAIRAHCVDCCCGSFHEVRLCTAKRCPLHRYRSGHRPVAG